MPHSTGAASERRALVLSILDPSRNGRTRRFIETLSAEGWTVDSASPVPVEPLPLREVFSLGEGPLRILLGDNWPLRRFLFRAALYVTYLVGFRPLSPIAVWLARQFLGTRNVENLSGDRYDLVVVEDFHLLATALDCFSYAPVIYDSRDYYHRLYEERLIWSWTIGRSLTQLSREALPKCRRLITVSEGLADEFRKEFGLEASVVMSVPDSPLRDFSRAIEPNSPIRLVYQGATDRNRRLDRLIEAVKAAATDIELDLYLVGSERALRKLARLSDGSERVQIKPAVPFSEIVETVARYDAGLVVYEPISVNMDNALPNKFFEYLRAGVPVIVGPTAEMARLVGKYSCGLALSGITIREMKDAFSSISRNDLKEWRDGALTFRDDYNWSNEREKFLQLVAEVVNSN